MGPGGQTEKDLRKKELHFFLGTMCISGLLLIFALSLFPFPAQKFRDTLKSFCT